MIAEKPDLLFAEYGCIEGHDFEARTANGELIGLLETADEVVQYVHVWPDYRRKGVATALWQFAKTKIPDLSHHTMRSRDGAAWIQSLERAETQRVIQAR